MLNFNFAASMPGIAAVFLAVLALLPTPSEAKTVPICIDDLCFNVPIDNATYKVREADLNGDGLKDLYVTGDSQRRAVGDFALMQAPGQEFALLANPSAAQRSMGMSGPITSVSIYRTDLSGDGLFDFYIENVDEVIPNARDLIVLTQYRSGSQAARILKVDDSFLSLVNEIETLWRDFDYYETIYRNTVCTQVIYYVPVYVGNPYGYGSSADFAGGASGYYYGGYTWLAYAATACIEGYKLFTPLGQSFMNSMAAATGAVELPGQVFTSPWFDRVIARASTLNRQVIFRTISQVLRTGSKAVKAYRAGATVAAVVLIADDVTVVGVADDGIAAGIALTILGSYVVDGAVTVLANAADTLAGPDVGPRPEGVAKEGLYAKSPRLTGADYLTAAGTHALPPNCQDESKMKAGQTVVPKPNRQHLRGNLRRAGCECPEESQAHHIAPLNGGGDNFRRVRQILAECEIDLDDAVNGVCLPNSDNASNTSAFRHNGSGGGIHDDDLAGRAIRDKLEAVLATTEPGVARQSGCRQVLREVGKDMTYGREFWLD